MGFWKARHRYQCIVIFFVALIAYGQHREDHWVWDVKAANGAGDWKAQGQLIWPMWVSHTRHSPLQTQDCGNMHGSLHMSTLFEHGTAIFWVVLATVVLTKFCCTSDSGPISQSTDVIPCNCRGKYEILFCLKI